MLDSRSVRKEPDYKPTLYTASVALKLYLQLDTLSHIHVSPKSIRNRYSANSVGTLFALLSRRLRDCSPSHPPLLSDERSLCQFGNPANVNEWSLWFTTRAYVTGERPS